jgi:hypothetical protein
VAIERHVVELSASDKLSPAFKNVAREAKAAGAAAETAGKKGTQSTADWGRAASALGAGLGVAFGAAIKLANESEVVQTRLQTSIENTGAAYSDFQAQIEAAAGQALDLGFDDEDALNALAKLTDASGDAEEAISQLAIAQDVARGRGISLAAASDLVVKATQGQYGALRRVGIQIDENATKEEALAALQQRYAGQAEAYARTNQATWDRVGNTIENKLEDIGGALVDFQGPLLALGGAGMAIGPLGDAIEALGGKARLASLGSSALSLALGPVGLIGIAATAAAGIAYLALTQEDQASAAELAAEANQSLTNSLADQATQLESQGVLSAAEALTATVSQLGENAAIASERITNAAAATETWRASGVSLDAALTFDAKVLKGIDDYTKSVADAADGTADGIITFAGLQAAITQLSAGFDDVGVAGESFTKTIQDIIALAGRSDLEGSRILADAQAIIDQLGAGAITAADAEAQLQSIISNYAAYSVVLNDTTDALDNLTKAQRDTYDSLTQLADEGLENAREQLRDMAEELEIMPDLLDALSASGQGFDFAISASGAVDAANALDNLTRIVIGNTDTIAGNSQALADWATEMRGFGADTDAVNDILEANESIQADILDIQAQQAPLLAELAQSQADYIDEISRMPAEQQLAALALMDTATAAQAQELTMLAAAAAAGELGAEGQAMAAELIAGAAEANPALAAVLEQMGLIDTSEGEIKINFPNATNLADTLDSLQTAITNLVTATYMLIVTADPDDAFQDVEDVKAAVEGLPDGTVDISANTNPYWSTVNSLDGTTVGTTYVDVYFNRRNNPDGSQPFALGGMIGTDAFPQAQLGRMGAGQMTLVGEAGPELVHLPIGSNVLPNHASRYQMGGGGGITFNGPITVVANNPRQFIEQLRDYQTHTEARR